MENYPFKWKLEADQLEMKVRLSIFTIISACAGLPALVWSVRNLTHHRKNGHQISVFIILLLLTDFVELLLSPYILFKYLTDESSWDADWPIRAFISVWQSSRVCGLLLNHLVALEAILSVKYPLYTDSVLFSLCFIILYIIVFICIIIVHMFLYWIYYFFTGLLMLIVSFITWIISCGASCSADRHSHTSRKPDCHIVVIFILTLLVFYLLPILFGICLILPTLSNLLLLWLIPSFLMSVRLISDPLLCVLVFRQNLRIQTSQNPEETSLV